VWYCHEDSSTELTYFVILLGSGEQTTSLDIKSCWKGIIEGATVACIPFLAYTRGTREVGYFLDAGGYLRRFPGLTGDMSATGNAEIKREMTEI